MTSLTFYLAATIFLGALFLRYGLDVRCKAGARNFVAPVWQTLIKLCALLIIAGFAWLVASMHQPGLIDWLGLSLGASGTAFVVAAKRTLGDAHTFTGQYMERSRLVTRGVYAITRNPLYFGVFQCELWALLVALHQLPVVQPQNYAYWLAMFGAAMVYAVAFNWRMAVCEACQLEHYFGDTYRRYRSRVPFLVPLFSLKTGDRAMPVSSAHTLQKRHFRLDACEGLSARGAWFAGKPLATQFLNAYTLLIPEGERFIIRSCRRYLDRADSGLREDLSRLFFQEGGHSREHGRLLAAMRAEGLGLNLFRRLVEGFSYRLLEPLSPPKLRLATAAAIEHHNAVIAGFFLRHGLLQGGRSGEMRRLFVWHFAEEIEHKEVVFKLLQRVSDSRLLRAFGLFASWGTFLFYLALGTLTLGVKTRAIFAGGFWRELSMQCCGRGGLLAVMVKESLHYLEAGFHPRIEESRDLLDLALAELERLGVEHPRPRSNAIVRPVPVAFRSRMTPSLERVGSLQPRLPYFGVSIGGYDGAWVQSDGIRKLNFCTYSYLGLLHHPYIQEAARQAIERYGTGTHGVRLLGGNLELHESLEARIATFFEREAAITFSSGFMTNLAVIASLVGRGDHVLSDRHNHASIVDGCRLSGAVVTRFKHNDMADLTDKLGRLPQEARKLIVVDAVYSMDGDIAPLEALIALRDRHPNTLLMVDEAHSLGVLGLGGRGVEEHFDCVGQVDVLMGSLSKAVPAQGGYIAGARDLITYLRSNARGFIFSAALPPATAAAALAAFELIDSEGVARRSRLMSNVHYFIQRLREAHFNIGNSVSAIVPIMLGSEPLAFDLARRCNLAGLYAMPVIRPAVPKGAERLRMNVTYDHRSEDLDFAVEVLERARAEEFHASH